MRSMIFLLTCALLSACASMPKEFEPYVKVFEKENNINLSFHTLEMKFSEMSPSFIGLDTVGTCSSVMGTPTIKINKMIWKHLTNAERQVTISHELGHCVLGLQHTVSGTMKPVLGENE